MLCLLQFFMNHKNFILSVALENIGYVFVFIKNPHPQPKLNNIKSSANQYEPQDFILSSVLD